MFRSFFVAAALATTAAVAQATDPAAAPIQQLDDGLVAIMKAGKAAGVAGRAAKIGPVVDRVFDLPLMTRLTIGPAWTGVAPADQQALVGAFRRLTVAQYANNFDGFSGESFVVAPQVESRGGDKLVRTTLKSPRDAGVAISYRLRDTGGGWKVVDVFYKNAISQVATRRSDFAAVLQQGGAKALVQHLDALATKAGG